MAGARRRAGRGVRQAPAGHVLPDAGGGADALHAEGHGSTRCYGSGKVADDFNVANKVYAQAAAGRRRTSTARCRRKRSPSTPATPASRTSARQRGSWSRPLAGLVAARQRADSGSAVVRRAARSLWCASATCRSSGTRWCKVTDPGDVDLADARRAGRARRRSTARTRHRRAPTGRPGHGRARRTRSSCPRRTRWRARSSPAFTTPPRRPDEPWLHQSLWHSIQVIFWGFLLSSIVGVPLGILCGALPRLARLTEPFIEFFRYLPAPAFGALAVAVLGIDDAPKIAIIFIGTFFQQVLVIANTTRRIDPALLEAAQTLGASRRAAPHHGSSCPAIIADLYTDMRILLGWAWTYLIVAELIGVSSGITYFINQQAKYRNYENVFASIILIGLIGLGTDLVLASLGRQLFPWLQTARRGWFAALVARACAAGAAAPPGPAAPARERSRRMRSRRRSTIDARRELPRSGARGRASASRAEAAAGHPRGATSCRRASTRRGHGRRSRRSIDVSFRAHRRELVCVIGPSGCGKSTLVRILAGLDDADRRATCCSTASRSAARARTAAWSSRATRSFPGCTVLEERDVRPRGRRRVERRRPSSEARDVARAGRALASSRTPIRTSSRAA